MNEGFKYGNIEVWKTLYTNPYVIFTETGYSKHYYAGSERIVSKIGEGLGGAITDITNSTVEMLEGNSYSLKADSIFNYLRNFQECVNMEPGNIEIPEGFEFLDESLSIPASVGEEDIYYYHTDHLGSSSWITYTDGSVTQHMQYLPFGESFIDQRSTTNSYDVRFKFTGKEKDLETGYNYFGARYYNSDISVWLSVDPKASHFPHISSYNYVELNPVKYIDEEGENPIGALIGGIIGGAKEIVSQTISNGFANMENEKGFFEDWGNNMDWGDVGISTVEGLLIGSGVGAAFIPLIEGGASVARSGFDWKGDDKTPNHVFGNGENKKDWKEFGYDLAGEAVSMVLEYGSGLNKVKFTNYNDPDLVGSLAETFGKGGFDGLWNSPANYYKQSYLKKRDRIYNYGDLSEVEIISPYSKNYSKKENDYRLFKKYFDNFMK